MSLVPAAGALMMWGAGTALSLSFVPGVLGGVVQMVALAEARRPVSDGRLVGESIVTALCCGLVALALAGTGSLAPSGAVLLAVLVGLTSPPGARLTRRLLLGGTGVADPRREGRAASGSDAA